jgi:hypothetical protein
MSISYRPRMKQSGWPGVDAPRGRACSRTAVLEYLVRYLVRVYCRVDLKKTGASRPRGARARDFVNFRVENHELRARGAPARVWQFTLPGSRLGTLPQLQVISGVRTCFRKCCSKGDHNFINYRPPDLKLVSNDAPCHWLQSAKIIRL